MSSSLAPYLFQEEVYRTPASTLIVIGKTWKEVGPDERALLSKILGSVRLPLSAVRVHTLPMADLQRLAAFSADRILVFGAPIDGVRAYELIQAQGFSLVAADDLSALDDTRKKSLWVALKSMFGM